MNLKSLLFFLLAIPAFALSQSRYTSDVESIITGEKAYEVTSFVEQYWRVVGNEGYNKSIYEIVKNLKEAGYTEESKSDNQTRLTYRIETRKLKEPTWEPVTASLQIKGEEGLLMNFKDNRNMIAVNSISTEPHGITAPVIYFEDPSQISDSDVEGKIVMVEAHPRSVFKTAVLKGKAAGIICYNMPSYLQPVKNNNSVQFRSIQGGGWAIMLSYRAKEILKQKMKKGIVYLKVKTETNIYKSKDLTVVADIKGRELPDERMVISAHVQEPGANDNASGVGLATEMAMATATLVSSGKLDPIRTITFLWGDEIISTRRYINENNSRAAGIKWGLSLDMVGENTDLTGGTFLIEKMPDPSAIWTRGKDKHTEWGGSKMSLNDMKPHYFNDFIINRFMEQGQRASWNVSTNPYEGGSDHVPFLRADIPGLLLWHFTDQFYHTDQDRIDKVSRETLKNVGTAALTSIYTLVNADESTAIQIAEEVKKAGIERLQDEFNLSKDALLTGAEKKEQIEILSTWSEWYTNALESCLDINKDSLSAAESAKVISDQKEIEKLTASLIDQL